MTLELNMGYGDLIQIFFSFHINVNKYADYRKAAQGYSSLSHVVNTLGESNILQIVISQRRLKRVVGLGGGG